MIAALWAVAVIIAVAGGVAGGIIAPGIVSARRNRRDREETEKTALPPATDREETEKTALPPDPPREEFEASRSGSRGQEALNAGSSADQRMPPVKPPDQEATGPKISNTDHHPPPPTCQTGPPGHVIAKGIDGGGTSGVLLAPGLGWPGHVRELIDGRQRGLATLADVEVLAYPSRGGGVELSIPGVVLLVLTHDRARLVLPSAAVRLGWDVERWCMTWTGWAGRLLGDARDVDGWETAGVDLHLDIAGAPIPDTQLVNPAAWTGRSVRKMTPAPDGYHELEGSLRLRGVWVNRKTANQQHGGKASVAAHGYNKSFHIEQEPDEPGHHALAEFYDRELARLHIKGPVWRWEASLSGAALDLRLQDDESQAVSLRSMRSWWDPRAIDLALAYAFGYRENPTSGAIRLTHPDDAELDAKRRRPHPLWDLLREGIAGPSTAMRFVQNRERAVEVERDARIVNIQRKASRVLADLAGAAGEARDPDQAAAYATQAVPQIFRRPEWVGDVAEARVSHGDLNINPHLKDK